MPEITLKPRAVNGSPPWARHLAQLLWSQDSISQPQKQIFFHLLCLLGAVNLAAQQQEVSSPQTEGYSGLHNPFHACVDILIVTFITHAQYLQEQ